MATNIEQRLKEMGLWERYRDIKTRQALMTPEELEKYGAFPDYSKITPPTAPAADIDTTQAPPIDSGAGDVLAAGEGAKGAAKTALQDYEKRIKELEEEAERRQKEAQEQMKKQQSLIDKLLKREKEAREEQKPREELLKEAKTAALEEMGLKPEDIRQIGGLVDEITEYQRQIANLEAQKQAAIDLNRQRPGRTMRMLTAEEAIIEKQYNSRIAAKAAQAGVASQKLQLLQGAYQDARNTARTIVEAALYDQRQELEDIEWSLSVHSDLYNLASKEEQQAWTREYNLKREQLEKDRAELQAKLDLMTAAAENGVKLGWDMNYIKSKSIEELTAEYAQAVEAMPAEEPTYAPSELEKEWQAAGGEAGTGMPLFEYIKWRRGLPEPEKPRTWTDAEIRKAVSGMKANNLSYQEALDEFELDPTVLNKNRAREIIAEMYGVEEEIAPEEIGPPTPKPSPVVGPEKEKDWWEKPATGLEFLPGWEENLRINPLYVE